MSLDRRFVSEEPVRTIDDLVVYFERACKPSAQWRVGIEQELLAIREPDGSPLPYEGPRGSRELLRRAERFGFAPFLDDGRPIAAEREDEWLSLEPGGQLELSGRPCRGASSAAGQNRRGLARVRALAHELDAGFLAMGYRPLGTPAQMPWVPKRRYAPMRALLGARGRLALDMMTLTASVQANFDFSERDDCAEKARAAASIAPFVIALFACSPLRDGRPAGHQSYRARVWQEVDPDRCGLPAFFFEPEGDLFRRYAEWAVSVPMIFIRRHGAYLPMEGLPFARFMAEGKGGERATLGDFADHLTVLFPEVRLKQVLELRSADASDPDAAGALAALGQGVLYDPQARADALSLTAKLSYPERMELQRVAARVGLAADVPAGKGRLQDRCRDLVAIAREGLRRQGARGAARLLEPLEEIAETGRSRADRLLEAYAHGGPNGLLEAARMGGDVHPVGPAPGAQPAWRWSDPYEARPNCCPVAWHYELE